MLGGGDPRPAPLARRYRRRQAALREALAETLRARPDGPASRSNSLPATSRPPSSRSPRGSGFEALVDPDSVGPGLFGEILSLVYDGLEARTKQ